MKVEIGDSNTKTKVESEPGKAKLLNSSELNSGKKERKELSGTQPLKWRFQVLNADLCLVFEPALYRGEQAKTYSKTITPIACIDTRPDKLKLAHCTLA